MHTWRALTSVTGAAALLTGGVTIAAAPAFADAPGVLPAMARSIGTIAGNGMTGSAGDGGLAINAQLNGPTGLAEDLSGSLYIADTENNRVRKVAKPTTLGGDVISAFAGTGKRGFSGDHGPAVMAEFNDPGALAVDVKGDLFIADTLNNRIREVNPSGIITTFAGTGECADRARDGGPATKASLCAPGGVAVDGTNVYVSDTGHNEVRVVNAMGVISDFAGVGKERDGAARMVTAKEQKRVQLASPTGLAVDALHDVFIADSDHDRVLEVAPSGVVTVIAGGHGEADQAASARHSPDLRHPTGVAVDPTGVVYISDTNGDRLLKVDSIGPLVTFAGTGEGGFSGDGGPATGAMIDKPTGVAVDGTAVYFADTENDRVRGVFLGPPPVLPEAPAVVLLALGAAVVGGGSVIVSRRRRQRRLPGKRQFT